MKIHRYLLLGLTAGLSAFAVSSCAYDGYSSNSYGGYGNGYGYGNSGFSTSYFISTGNSRWGYDPYSRSYYDYSRRAYYDPYLNGYYPVGYRPRYVSGAPHPYGWSNGRKSISPPRSVRNYNLKNYGSRTDRYRNLGKDWSRNVRNDSSRGQRQQFDNSRGQRSNSSDRGQRTQSSSGFQRGSDNSSRFRGNTTVATPQQRVQGNRSSGNSSSRSNFRQPQPTQSNSSRNRGSSRSAQPQRAPSRSNSNNGGGGNRSSNQGDVNRVLKNLGGGGNRGLRSSN